MEKKIFLPNTILNMENTMAFWLISLFLDLLFQKKYPRCEHLPK